MSKVLTPEAEDERGDFVREYGYHGNCSCFISPPCCSCMHPGNPLQQECNDAAWMEEWLGYDAMVEQARYAVAATIEDAAGRHLTEMRAAAEIGRAIP